MPIQEVNNLVERGVSVEKMANRYGLYESSYDVVVRSAKQQPGTVPAFDKQNRSRTVEDM